MKDTSNKKMHEQNQTELELIGGSFSLDKGLILKSRIGATDGIRTRTKSLEGFCASH